MKAKKFYNLFSLRKRLLCVLLSFVCLFVALICRLFYLQIIDGKTLQMRAVGQWLRDLPLASKRGDIIDRNGVVLASSVTTYDIYVRARNVTDAAKLSKLLSDKLKLDYDKVYKKVTNVLISESLIKMQVDEKTSLELANSGLKGIYLSQNVGRVYPFNDLLTQVLGYCSIDNSGQTGIENYYNDFLSGVDGKSMIQSNAQGKEIEGALEYFLPSIDGADIYLSIDSQIQSILETALMNAYVEHKAKGAWGIMLDATTGDILAMSNLPSFDLNHVPRNDLNELNKLSKNSCVVDVYEPGSTFKIVTMLAALNEGVTDLDERFYCAGSTIVDGQKIKCWRTQGHGSETLGEGFKNSCNCVFVNLALRLGIDRLYKYFDYFGIGKKTGVDISSESAGIVMNKSRVKTVDLARIGFGQSVAVTPLQLVTATARITTGKNITPHLLKSVIAKDKTLYEYYDKSEKIDIDPKIIEELNTMLFNNVNTEMKASFVEGYFVGGKTGTAQKFKNGALDQGKYVSSFIGVYPSNQPRYALIICIDEPSNGVYYGGMVAKPVGQEIFSNLFRMKNIPPDDPDATKLVPNVAMPNLVGLSVAEALSKLKLLNLNADVDGEGGVVISQLPIENTMLYPESEVLLRTNFV